MWVNFFVCGAEFNPEKESGVNRMLTPPQVGSSAIMIVTKGDDA